MEPAVVQGRSVLAIGRRAHGLLLHVLVGGVSIVAAAFVWLTSKAADRPRYRAMLSGMLFGTVLALPSVWAALQLDRGVEPQVAARAAEIQVYDRLPHHLNPGDFFI